MKWCAFYLSLQLCLMAKNVKPALPFLKQEFDSLQDEVAPPPIVILVSLTLCVILLLCSDMNVVLLLSTAE